MLTGQPAHRADDGRDQRVRHRLLAAAQRLHLRQRARRLPERQRPGGGLRRRRLRGALQGLPAGPEAAGVHPDCDRGPRRAGHLPAGGRQHQ